MDILVLGARGGLGRLVCGELEGRGHRIRMVSRPEARDPDALARAAGDGGTIVNCAGASMALGLGHGWRGYRAVDTPIGLAAVEAAHRTGARLIYIGVHHDPAIAHVAYIDAHERVIAAMDARGVDGVVIRATGFFSAFAGMLGMARRGFLLDVGSGRARTNPIDERDLATIVAEHTPRGGPRALSAGGPEVLERRQILEQIAARAGRRVRILRMPIWFANASGAVMRAFHPRLGQLGRFGAALGGRDLIAPALGTTTLARYLDEAVRTGGDAGAGAGSRERRAKSSSAR